jgi:hypothetical protein
MALRVPAEAGRETRLGAHGDQQLVRSDRVRSALETIRDRDSSGREVDRGGFGFEKLHTPQRLTDRHDDRAGVQTSRGDLVQHRRKDREILRVYKHHFDARITGDVRSR